MELKLWEREWLDISFKKAGLSPSYLNLPTKNFYDNFCVKIQIKKGIISNVNSLEISANFFFSTLPEDSSFSSSRCLSIKF